MLICAEKSEGATQGSSARERRREGMDIMLAGRPVGMGAETRREEAEVGERTGFMRLVLERFSKLGMSGCWRDSRR